MFPPAVDIAGVCDPELSSAPKAGVRDPEPPPDATGVREPEPAPEAEPDAAALEAARDR